MKAEAYLLPVDYTPWWAQRMFHRSRAWIRVIVAGRQSGKTHAAAREVVALMLQRPGTDSCLLMPVKKATVGPIKHLRAVLVAALGAEGGRWTWHATDAYFELWNGAKLYVRTCDTEAKQGLPTRGLTLDGVLWVDEAAYVPESAWNAARITQAAVADPRAIVTSTPCGKNWLYKEFQSGTGKKSSKFTESFRFRSTQSPFCNPSFIEDQKQKLGAKKAMQELDAVFLGDGGSVFKQEDIEFMLSAGALPFRGAQLTIGLDLAKERDFTVVTLMNEFGETWLLWRVRHVDWPDQEKKIIELANADGRQALVVVDIGHGGGYGGTMKDYLIRSLGESRVLTVKTGNRGVKSQIVETLIADMENRRLLYDPGEEVEVVRNELLFFEGKRRVVAGTEIWSYGRQGEAAEEGKDELGDHDDTVISLGLANWGRLHGWERDTGNGGIEKFRRPMKPAGGATSPRVRGSGYIFK